jgi:hypothetical protein
MFSDYHVDLIFSLIRGLKIEIAFYLCLLQVIYAQYGRMDLDLCQSCPTLLSRPLQLGLQRIIFFWEFS